MSDVTIILGGWAVFAAGIPVAIYRRQLAVLLWMAAMGTVLLPLFAAGHAAVYVGTAYLCVLLTCWAWTMPRQGRSELAGSALTSPLIALALVAALSAVSGAVTYDPAVTPRHGSILVVIYATALVVLSPAAALVVARHLDSERALRWAYRIVVGVGLVILVSLFIPIPVFERPRWWPLLVSYSAALILARLLYDPPPQRWLRIAGAAAIAFALVRVVLSELLQPTKPQWISGWVMLVAPLLWIISQRFDLTWAKMARGVRAARVRIESSRHRALVLTAMAMLMALVIGLVYGVVRRAGAESDFARFSIWLDAGRLWLRRPLLGVGPGNYLDYAHHYATRRFVFTSAHGNYQQIVAEMGALGLLALAWVFVRAFRLGRRLVATAQDPFLRAFAIGIMGGLAGLLLASALGDYAVPAYHNGGHTSICTTIYGWILIGVLMAIEARVANRP